MTLRITESPNGNKGGAGITEERELGVTVGLRWSSRHERHQLLANVGARCYPSPRGDGESLGIGHSPAGSSVAQRRCRRSDE